MSEPAVLVGEASTSKAKGKGPGRGRKAREQRSQPLLALEVLLLLPRRKGALEEGLSQLLSNSDVYGPLSILARGGFSYFITFTDDHSRYGYVYLMRYKSETIGRFIGYPKETGGYYFYDPAEQKIFVPRNAVFLKKSFPSNNRRDEVLIEESNEEPQHDNTTSFEPSVHTDGVPVLRRSTRESRVPERYGFVGLTSQLDNNPKTYGEAISNIDSDKWFETMKSEMGSMGLNQVWTLVDPPKGFRPVGYKCVYKHKLGAVGEVTAFRARLMAKGYTQRPGVDFEENYSPVAMAKSIRILLAVAAWYDNDIWQMDVKTAFLNGFVEDEIYMDQPEGFTTVGEEQKVCRLKRSIYGLKQASRSWNTHFDEVI
ncbi:UNVERIFIED_CONTAM: Retrovirus-related Pol polyprotein from transposon RE2 [Sesamum radiatum]|uniref:Retrovirus-related Pol polyprotein from transposon RE2 n=1 Tax=Sesamum radiatum TaxID=300843 RepID=A0AAW2JEQ8_SESRA